jgi:hypothetical protein
MVLAFRSACVRGLGVRIYLARAEAVCLFIYYLEYRVYKNHSGSVTQIYYILFL